MDSESLFRQAEQILTGVRSFITDESDIVWTSYNSPAEMRSAIDSCIEKIRVSDIAGIEQAAFLFAPTGDFQEHSISNGWGKEYIRLSSAFDPVEQALKGRR